MPTEFRDTSGDSGYNIAAAIEPYSNGEGANEITFRRPVEHLRHRTEVLRQELDELWAVVSSDRGLTLLADFETEVTWGGPVDSSPAGTGIFTLTPAKEVRLVPLTTPSGGGVSWTENNILNRLTYVFNTNKQFTVRSKLRISEGGNNLLLELFKENGQYFGGGAGVQVTVEGSKNGASEYDPLAGPVLVRVQLSHNGTAITSAWSDVITGIGLATLPNTWLAAAVTSDQGAVLAVEIARQYLWEGTGTGMNPVAGCDAQAYRITAAQFATHFATPANWMYKGDALVLDFTSAKARLDAGGDESLGAALVTVHRSEATEPPDPRSVSGSVNLMHAIPIAKVIDDDLFFFNGSRIAKAATVPLGSDSTLRSALSVDTGINAGATLVGAAEKEAIITGEEVLPLDEGTVEEQLQQLLEYVASLTGGAVDDVKCITITAKDDADYIKAYSSFMPYGTDAADRNLGEEAHPWNSAYSSAMHTATLYSAAAATDHIDVDAHLLPGTSKTLGTTGARWAAVWAVDMTLTTSLTVPTIHGDGTNLTIHDNLISASGKTLGLVGTPWVNIWGTTITATDIYATTVRTGSLYGNTGNITAYNSIVASGTIDLGTSGGGGWANVFATHVHAANVYASNAVNVEALGGGIGGQLLVGAGEAAGVSAYVTYSGLITTDTTSGNDVKIVSHHANISQAAWLKVLNGTTVYAVPLFTWVEVM